MKIVNSDNNYNNNNDENQVLLLSLQQKIQVVLNAVSSSTSRHDDCHHYDECMVIVCLLLLRLNDNSDNVRADHVVKQIWNRYAMELTTFWKRLLKARGTDPSLYYHLIVCRLVTRVSATEAAETAIANSSSATVAAVSAVVESSNNNNKNTFVVEQQQQQQQQCLKELMQCLQEILSKRTQDKTPLSILDVELVRALMYSATTTTASATSGTVRDEEHIHELLDTIWYRFQQVLRLLQLQSNQSANASASGVVSLENENGMQILKERQDTTHDYSATWTEECDGDGDDDDDDDNDEWTKLLRDTLDGLLLTTTDNFNNNNNDDDDDEKQKQQQQQKEEHHHLLTLFQRVVLQAFVADVAIVRGTQKQSVDIDDESSKGTVVTTHIPTWYRNMVEWLTTSTTTNNNNNTVGNNGRRPSSTSSTSTFSSSLQLLGSYDVVQWHCIVFQYTQQLILRCQEQFDKELGIVATGLIQLILVNIAAPSSSSSTTHTTQPSFFPSSTSTSTHTPSTELLDNDDDDDNIKMKTNNTNATLLAWTTLTLLVQTFGLDWTTMVSFPTTTTTSSGSSSSRATVTALPPPPLGNATLLCTILRLATGEWRIQLERHLSSSYRVDNQDKDDNDYDTTRRSQPQSQKSSSLLLLAAGSNSNIGNDDDANIEIVDSCSHVITTILYYLLRMVDDDNNEKTTTNVLLQGTALLHLRDSLQDALYSTVQYLCHDFSNDGQEITHTVLHAHTQTAACRVLGGLLTEFNVWDGLPPGIGTDETLRALSVALKQQQHQPGGKNECDVVSYYSFMSRALVMVLASAEDDYGCDCVKLLQEHHLLGDALVNFLVSLWTNATASAAAAAATDASQGCLVEACQIAELWYSLVNPPPPSIAVTLPLRRAVLKWLRHEMGSTNTSSSLLPNAQVMACAVDCAVMLYGQDAVPSERDSMVIQRVLEICQAAEQPPL